MKKNEMRQLSTEELEARVGDWQEDLFRAKCNKTIGQATNPLRIRTIRREIARAKTIISEINRNAAEQS